MNSNKNLEIDKNLIDGIFKKISKDVIKYLPSKFIPAIIGLISLPIYTSIFSPTDYGLYSMIVSLVGLISSICAGWLSHSALRYYDEYKVENKEKEYFSTLFATLFAVYFFACL